MLALPTRADSAEPTDRRRQGVERGNDGSRQWDSAGLTVASKRGLMARIRGPGHGDRPSCRVGTWRGNIPSIQSASGMFASRNPLGEGAGLDGEPIVAGAGILGHFQVAMKTFPNFEEERATIGTGQPSTLPWNFNITSCNHRATSNRPFQEGSSGTAVVGLLRRLS